MRVSMSGTLRCFGDGATAGTGISQTSAYPQGFANLIGLETDFKAVGGVRIATIANSQVYPTKIVHRDQSIIIPGMNDMYYWPAESLQTAGRTQFLEALTAILAWLSTPDTTKQYAQNAGSYSGSWDNSTDYGGAISKYASTTATATFTVYGSTIIIGTTKKHSSGGNFSITIDGNSQGNISSSGGADYSGEPTYHPIVTIYTGLTNTTHTVVLTSSISGTSQVDYITALSFPLDGYVNKVYCGGTPRILSTSYDTEADYYNTLCQSAITTISTIGLPVVYSNTPNWYNPREHLAIGSDSFNPSATGHTHIAEKFTMDNNHLKNKDILTVGPFDDCDYKTDGTDDAVQVNQALLAAGNRGTVIGYGDLYIAPGNPISIANTNLTCDTNFWAQRDLHGKTFQGPTNSPRGLRLHLTGSSAGMLISIYGSGIVVKNMTLDGNRIDANKATINQTGSYGIYINSLSSAISNTSYTTAYGGFYGGILSNLIISDCGDAGIYVAAGAQSLGYANWHDIWINRCLRGLHFESGADLLIHNLTISNPYFNCIYMTGTAGSIQFIGGHFWEGGNGILDETTRNNIFTNYGGNNVDNCYLGGIGFFRFHGCTFDQFNRYGIYAPSSYNIVQGCEFHGSYLTSSRCIETTGRSNVITGNIYYRLGSAEALTNAIELATGSSYNVVVGNSWESANTILNNGTNNIIAYNNG